jgi:hypothetical protein
LKPYWEKIHPNLKDEEKKKLIESVTLYLVDGGGLTDIEAEKQRENGSITLVGDALRWEFKKDLMAEIKYFGKNSPTMFLSIKFNGGAIKNKIFKHYNFDSPWNIQVGIYGSGVEVFGNQKKTPNPIGRVAQEMQHKAALNKPSSWQIMRHKKFGEIPSFKWRLKH